MRRMFALIALVVLAATPADAAVLATPAFSWNLVTNGFAQCRILNVSAASATVTVTMYVGPVALNTDTTQIGPNGGTFASATVNFTADPLTNPSHCTCTVPDTSKFLCSFSYVSPSGAVTVVPGE